MSELTYPAFPKRALTAMGVVLVALCAIAIVVNRNGPDVPGCTAAAARLITARNYTVARVTHLGPGRVPACGRLTVREFARAVAHAHAIDYARSLPHTPILGSVPPASFRALSAQTASRER